MNWLTEYRLMVVLFQSLCKIFFVQAAGDVLLLYPAHSHKAHISTEHTLCHSLVPNIFETSTIKLLTLPIGNNCNCLLQGALWSSRNGCQHRRQSSYYRLLLSSESQRSAMLITLLLSCPLIICRTNVIIVNIKTATGSNKRQTRAQFQPRVVINNIIMHFNSHPLNKQTLSNSNKSISPAFAPCLNRACEGCWKHTVSSVFKNHLLTIYLCWHNGKKQVQTSLSDLS